jgi:hypothetical protein
MEVIDYCRNVEMELNSWKTKLYDVVQKMGMASPGNREEIYEDINGIHVIITKLEDRIDRLRSACPKNWRPLDRDIRVRLGDLEKRYKKASKDLFSYGG